MDIKLRYKEGKAMAVTESGEARIIKLVLKDEFLEIMEKLNPCKMDNVGKIQQIASNQKLATESSFSFSKLPVERTVEIIMDDSNPSLGISVKGGADFNLPILISRIIPGEVADKTKRLFVGDAILELNGKSMLSCSHKEAVDAMLSAGCHVTVQVRHLPHAATVLLNEGVFKKQLSSIEDKDQAVTKECNEKECRIAMEKTTTHINGMSDHNGSYDNIYELPTEKYSYLVDNSKTRKIKGDSKNWVIGLRLSLQYAYLSVFQYQGSLQLEKLNSFIVRSIEGHSTGIISFKDPNQFHYWKEAIKFNINSLLINNIKKYNHSSTKDNQVHYMGWLYFIGESNGDGLVACKSYHEGDYANIDSVRSRDTKESIARNGKVQCIQGKKKSLDDDPPIKWCYLPGTNFHKSSVNTSTKLKPSDHLSKVQSHLVQKNAAKSHGDRKKSTIERPLFLILRGIYVYIFVRPPTAVADWFSPLKQYLVSRSMIGQRRQKFLVQSSSAPMTDDVTSTGNVEMTESIISQISQHDRELSPTTFVLKMEVTEFDCVTDSLADLLELETIWVRVNYYAVSQMRMDSFKCIYQNIDCILCLDFDYGVKLINAADGIKIWQFKYHQLRASSDDGENRLRLIFSETGDGRTRIDQVLHCHSLGTVLISIQSFLTAKLGQVDPHYFDS